MSFGHVIDIDNLVAPINDDTPQGVDIREDRSPTSDYYTIKDARNNARATERSAVFGGEEADLITPWVTVCDVASRILSSSSKDLEVASWYLEGLIRLNGASGLRDGLLLINHLVKDHWDGLFPRPDEDGIETLVSCLTGLNGDGGDGTLLTPLRNVEITNDVGFGAFTFWQYQQARDADRIEDEDRKAERVESLGYSLETINNTVTQTDLTTCQNFIATLEECSATFKDTSAKLREQCAADAPPSSKISELLDEIVRTTRFLYKEKVQAAEEAAAADEAATAEADSAEDGVSESVTSGNVIHMKQAAAGPIVSREDALKRLEEVAKYFRQYEPHTPIAPGLERLVSWGRMTVSELMMELIPDSTARSLFSQFTGATLDGSDTNAYVAPPPVATAAVPATADATPEATAEPEPKKDTSW